MAPFSDELIGSHVSLSTNKPCLYLPRKAAGLGKKDADVQMEKKNGSFRTQVPGGFWGVVSSRVPFLP